MLTHSQVRSLVVITLCAGWIRFLWVVNPDTNAPAFYGFGGVLLVASGLALRRFTLAHVKLGWAIQALLVATLALLMFVAWGAVALQITVLALPQSWPVSVKLGFIFAGPVFAAAVTAALFYYPLNILFPRKHWLVPVTASTLVMLIQFDGLFAGTVDAPVNRFIVYETLCLTLLVPLFHWLLAAAIRPRVTAMG